MASCALDLSILVVGYNSCRYLDACIGAIPAAARSASFEVLFVNNGTDGSEDFLSQAHPGVRILETRGNIGFAEGNNYLATHAQGQYLLLLNPDTKLYPDAIDRLVDAARANPAFAALGGITVGRDGQPESLANMELPTLRTMLRALVGRASRKIAFTAETPIIEADAINGGFMMVERACWELLGGMDRAFFLYAEEIDFFKRLKQTGRKVGIVPASRIYHDLGSGEVNSPTRKFYLATGNAHYLRKHFPPFQARLCIFIYWLVLSGRYVSGLLLIWKGTRYRNRARAFQKLALRPWTWMRGFDSPGADPRKAAA